MARKLLKAATVAALPAEIGPGDYDRIAARTGATPSYVREIAGRVGVAPPRVRRLPEAPETIRLLRNGVKPADISNAAGVTRAAVYRQLMRAGYGIRAGVVFELTTASAA